MATEEAEVPEGFTKAEAPNQNSDDDYDTEWVERPMQGELLQGNLLAVKPDRGEYDTTIIEMRLTEPYGSHDADDLVCFWSTQGIDDALDENNIRRGDEIALTCDETFDVDGDERRNYAVYTKED
jgi:hypothetical protein